MDSDGIMASGWDIWRGGTSNAMGKRIHGDTVEEFMGKRKCVNQVQPTVASDLLGKIKRVRSMLSARRAS